MPLCCNHFLNIDYIKPPHNLINRFHMNTNYKDKILSEIPRAARIQQAIKKGYAKFVDIEIRKKADNIQSQDSLKVINTDKLRTVSFVIKKKLYDDFYDCYDVNNKIINKIFICKLCHDCFSAEGGNVARHFTQHARQNQNQHNQILKKIRLFIYRTAQPFSIIEDETFRDLFDVNLCSVDKLENLMKLDFAKLLTGIQNEIDSAQYVSLVLDEWSSNNSSFIGLTAYLTGINVKHDSIVLALTIPSELDRTASTLSNELLAQFNKYNFGNKIIGSVTDCAAVMKKTMQISKVFWSPCLSHIIHNAVKNMLKGNQDFSKAMLHANDLSSDHRFKQYLSICLQRKKNIRTFNDTRWLSRFKTCHDIVEFCATMKHFETAINKLIKTKNNENSINTAKYVCPITSTDYNICVSFHDSLLKLSKLILLLEKRSHDNYFYALFWIVKYIQSVTSELQSNGLSLYADKL